MLANGATVDWRLVEAEATGAAIPVGLGARWRRVAAIGWKAIVVVGLLQLALVTMQAQAALSRPASPMPGWLFLANVLLFGVSGALLLLGGRHDLRPQALGAVFVMIAATFAHTLIARIDSPGWIQRGFVSLNIDAFLAAALWRFVWAFPRIPEGRAVRHVGLAFLWISSVIGILLVAANLLDEWVVPDTSSTVQSLLRAFDGGSPTRHTGW